MDINFNDLKEFFANMEVQYSTSIEMTFEEQIDFDGTMEKYTDTVECKLCFRHAVAARTDIMTSITNTGATCDICTGEHQLYNIQP